MSSLDLSAAVELLTELLDDLDEQGMEEATLEGAVVVVEIRFRDEDGDWCRSTFARTNTGPAFGIGLIEVAGEQIRSEIRNSTEDD